MITPRNTSKLRPAADLQDMISALIEDGYQVQFEQLHDTYYAYILEGDAVALAEGSDAFHVASALREAIRTLESEIQ